MIDRVVRAIEELTGYEVQNVFYLPAHERDRTVLILNAPHNSIWIELFSKAPSIYNVASIKVATTDVTFAMFDAAMWVEDGKIHIQRTVPRGKKLILLYEHIRTEVQFWKLHGKSVRHLASVEGDWMVGTNPPGIPLAHGIYLTKGLHIGVPIDLVPSKDFSYQLGILPKPDRLVYVQYIGNDKLLLLHSSNTVKVYKCDLPCLAGKFYVYPQGTHIKMREVPAMLETELGVKAAEFIAEYSNVTRTIDEVKKLLEEGRA